MRGHIRPRGSDGKTWAIVVDLGRGPGGKRRQKWVTVHGTKKQAASELTKILSSLDAGTYVEPTKLTVGEYLQRWLDDYAKANVAAKTFERYSEIVTLYLTPALGGHPLSKLQPLHIQACYSELLQSGRKVGKGGLSPQTVLHAHRVLREALHQAVRWQLLVRNPVDAVEPPRPARREMRALDEAATAQVLAAARESWIYMPLFLAATTGMRRGEVLALRWEDVDLAAGVLSVRQSLQQTKDGLTFKAPKTAKGRRLVTLPAITVETLRHHQHEQKVTRVSLGPAFKDQGLVCCEPTGVPLDPSAVSHAFRRLARSLGLEDVHLHTLRHSHATQLLRQGVPVKVVSERLGHATTAITMDVYSHVLPGMQEEAARRVDTALRAALGNARQA